MELITKPRKAGKTMALVQWVKEGEKTSLYPFWTRVILVDMESTAQEMRRRHGLEYRQVFSIDSWRTGRIIEPCEVAIDNADQVLQRLIQHGHLTRATFTEVIHHPFDPGSTGRSVECNQLVLDWDGAATLCRRGRGVHER